MILSEDKGSIEFDMTNSNKWARDVAGDDEEFFEILEERRQECERAAMKLARGTNCEDYVRGLRWSDVDFTYSRGDRVLNMGLFFHMEATDR
jgi:hypothetical protein